MRKLLTFLQIASPGARCRRKKKERKAGLFFVD